MVIVAITSSKPLILSLIPPGFATSLCHQWFSMACFYNSSIGVVLTSVKGMIMMVEGRWFSVGFGTWYMVGCTMVMPLVYPTYSGPSCCYLLFYWGFLSQLILAFHLTFENEKRWVVHLYFRWILGSSQNAEEQKIINFDLLDGLCQWATTPQMVLQLWAYGGGLITWCHFVKAEIIIIRIQKCSAFSPSSICMVLIQCHKL